MQIEQVYAKICLKNERKKVNRLKKVFALLICAVMLFAFTACLATPEPEIPTEPETVSGETPVSGASGAYKFDEYSDHIVLTQYVGKDANLVMPSKINHKPVTGFGTIFKGNMNLVSITVGKNVTEIDAYAFQDCYNLQRVQIESGVKSIGELAFFGCQALKLAYIPANVEQIAPDAFKYCTDLLIYGDSGSAIEQFAEGFNSIYFRSIADVIGTTAEESSVTAEESSVTIEETSLQEIL